MRKAIDSNTPYNLNFFSPVSDVKLLSAQMRFLLVLILVLLLVIAAFLVASSPGSTSLYGIL